jgi:hypothetical protein
MKKIYSFLFLLLFAFSAKSQIDVTIGTATGSNTTSSYPCPIQDFYEGSRSQYLYLASELQAAGIGAGFINSIKFNATSVTASTGTNFPTVEQYTISIGSTAIASLDATAWETGTTPVFGPVDYTITVGVNEFIFTTPFFWNGTDNIVLDICNGDPNNTTYTSWTNNAIFPWTSGLSFNGSHSYRADNLGNLCGTATLTENGTPTTRPDATFNWTSPTVCSGIPTAGLTASNKDTVCANKQFNLYTLGATVGTGLTYQWQDSIPGVSSSFTNIAGATGFSYAPSAGITVAKYFRRKITCTGLTRISAPKYIFVRPFYECYCGPFINTTLHTSSTAPTIESVGIVGGTLNYTNSHPGSNPAPTLGYAYFTDTTGVLNPPIPLLKQATTYTMTVTTSTTPANNSAGFWIDWNHNGTYDSAEYVNIPFAATTTAADIAIEVPENATLGLTMMRIRTNSFGFTYASGCAALSNGETEDYIFRVIAGAPCAGTPVGGTAVASVTSICPNIAFDLSVINATEGVTNLSYQWQDSSSQHGWQDITLAKSKKYKVSGITVDTWYRRKITCGNSNLSATSLKTSVTMNPLFECYCSPSNGVSLHSAINPTIETVAIDGGTAASGITNYSNSHPGANPAPSLGYAIFSDTNQAPILSQEVPYTLTVTASATPQKAAVWIDYDHSGTLDPSEMQTITFAAGATTGDVIINPPANCVLGFTIMRVRIRVASFTTACENFGSGETEDYVIKIKPGASCTGKPVAGTAAASTAISCNGIPILLTVTGATEGYIGLSYQWQDSIPGVSTKFTNRSFDTLASLTTTQNVAKHYRRLIKCKFSVDTSYSTSVFVDQNLVTYATIPFTEDFENTWVDGCGDANSRTVPSNNWRNYPLMGDSSWRRNDDGVAASWILPNSGIYTPASTTGTYSARFHTYEATNGTSGNFDLFLDCSGGSAIKRLTFDYINTTGSDSMVVMLSTNGGATFSRLDSARVSTDWSTRTIDFTSTSATTVVRFKATSDFGVTDIGIDNLAIVRLNAVDLAVNSVVSPTGSFSITNTGNITVSVTNFGAVPINFSTLNATLGARVKTPSGSTVFYSKVLNTGTLASGATQNYDIKTASADFSTIGNYTIKAGVGVAGDANPLNDSTTTTSFVTTSLVIYAVANGNWGDGATWSTGTVPTSSDTATIAGYTVTLGGAAPSPYSCSSLGIGNGGTLAIPSGTLNIGAAGGSNKALTFAKGAKLDISGGTLNHNGYVLFNDSSNFVMSAGSLKIDGNNGTDAGSVPTGTDLLQIGTAAKPYSFGSIDLTGGTITFLDPHRFNGNVLGYRGTIVKNAVAANTIELGDGISTQTSSTGTGGFVINSVLSSARLSVGSLTVNGGNTVGNRFTSLGGNIGINGNLTINANSEFRSTTFTAYVSGNLTNNGTWATGSALNLQTYLAGTAGPVTTGQTISGIGIYRNNNPTASVSATGSGYAVGDILTLNGGTYTTPATVYVLSVGGTGSIISSVLLGMGNYTVAPTGTLTVTGGSGSGATFTSANLLTAAKFAGLAVNNTSASGVTISSFGTTLPSQIGTISGTGVLTMVAGVINNGNNVITLGNSLAQRGSLNYTSGLITGKFRRWFTTATNVTTTGDFPVGKGTFARPARVEFTTAPTKGGLITAEYIATAPGLGGLPLTDGAATLVNIANDGYWRLETDSITGGAYNVSITDSGISNVQTVATLRSVKRAVGATNWGVEGTAGTNTGTITKPVVVRTGLSLLGEYAIAGAVDNILPLSNVKFTGEKSGNANNLKWIVVNELEVKGYELQRSSNGNTFEAVGFVNSKATGSQVANLNYSFVDNNSISNDAYYRLKQVAKDGSFDYSNVVLIKGLKVNGLVVGNVYPNPVKELLNVTIASSNSKSVKVSITDILGKTVLNTAATLVQGDNNIQIKLGKLSVGSYTITLMDTNGKKSNNVTFIKE